MAKSKILDPKNTDLTFKDKIKELELSKKDCKITFDEETGYVHYEYIEQTIRGGSAPIGKDIYEEIKNKAVNK